MKRASIHKLFLLVTLTLLTITCWQLLFYRQQLSLNKQLMEIPKLIASPDEFKVHQQHEENPQVQLALANAYSAGGNLPLTESSFNRLVKNHGHGPIGIAARFNLGNAYFRQATNDSTPENQKRPMLELAKQRYRDLLILDSDHWPARYNLERALRLAPELISNQPEKRVDPVKRVQVIVPGFEKKDLP